MVMLSSRRERSGEEVRVGYFSHDTKCVSVFFFFWNGRASSSNINRESKVGLGSQSGCPGLLGVKDRCANGGGQQ